ERPPGPHAQPHDGHRGREPARAKGSRGGAINGSSFRGGWSTGSGRAETHRSWGARRTTSSASENRDVWQIAELFGVIEAVADHEAILDFEAGIFHLHVHPPARGLAPQTRGAK